MTITNPPPSNSTQTVAHTLQQAVACHKAGDLKGAEQLYRAILKANPHHPDANHNLGVVAVQVGQPSGALPYLKAALEANPGNQHYWSSYVGALIKTDQRNTARQLLTWGREQGIPESVFALAEARMAGTEADSGPAPKELELLVMLFNQFRYAEAESLARELTERFPEQSIGWKGLGFAYRKQGKVLESLLPLQKAVALNHLDAETHSYLGSALWELKRPEEAEASYHRALEINPDYAEVHNYLGNTFWELGRMEKAEASYRRALTINPNYAEAHNNLGSVLWGLGRLEEAEASCRRAVAINPNYADAHCNLGVILKGQGRSDDALASYRQSLMTKNDWEAALQRLTDPLVLCAGMIRETHLVTSGNLGISSPEQVVCHPEPGVGRRLRIVLIYPPPWQIPSPGDPPFTGMPFGQPLDKNDHALDRDFQAITYGLLTIAAQAKRAGYTVTVCNLSVTPWQEVVRLIAETEADIYGISAFTANRRGMGAIAALIRAYYPQAHITAGGPFVTALPLDTLRYFKEIDTVVIGEGENTFMELLEYLESGRQAIGISGTAWRNGDELVVGSRRPRIDDLDALAVPFDYFTSNIVMTSRGCPSTCSFCGSVTTWGKQLRFHSAKVCLDIFKKALARLPIPFIMIKDDTFTAHRGRAIEICDSIIASRMNFIWSCDTRADALDDELLRKMRLAGCQMISLGVESGAPELLKSMHKGTTPEMVREVTRSARKYGMSVRYYMILCSRGETAETIQQSIDLIQAGRPERYFFSALSFYPGTEDWAILSDLHALTPDIFFNNDFKELSIATNRQKELQEVLRHVQCTIGALSGFNYTVEEREAVVELLPDVHSVHLELANAYLRNGQLDKAEAALNQAEKLGFPIIPVAYNQRACIALAKGDINNARLLLDCAVQSYPHSIVMKNYKKLRAWDEGQINSQRKPPVLNDSALILDFVDIVS